VLPITSDYQMVADTAHGHLFRPEFLPSAKDIFNVSTAGPWHYYLVTS
jgi:hypothetical protein